MQQQRSRSVDNGSLEGVLTRGILEGSVLIGSSARS